jgi:hypothetical protein
MPDYRRYRVAGGTYFFTVNLLQRYPNDLLVRPIEFLNRGAGYPGNVSLPYRRLGRVTGSSALCVDTIGPVYQ